MASYDVVPHSTTTDVGVGMGVRTDLGTGILTCVDMNTRYMGAGVGICKGRGIGIVCG